jgi:hypothetical protein
MLAIQTEPNTNVLGVELAGLSRMKRVEILAWLQERRDIATRHDEPRRNRRMGNPNFRRCRSRC